MTSLKPALHIVCFVVMLLILKISAFAEVPSIKSFTPSSGPVGAIITISGSGFDTNPLNDVVFIGGIKADVKQATTSTLNVIVPAGSQIAPITVINTSTGLQATSVKQFNTTFKENGTNIFQSRSFVAQSFSELQHGGFHTYMNLTDVDGDGRLDIVVTNSFDQTVNIYRNHLTTAGTKAAYDLSATFNVTPDYLTYTPQAVKFADLDGDGKQDLVIPYLGQGKVAIYKNNCVAGSISRQSFGNEIQLNVGATKWVSLADLDADGKVDIINTTLNGVSILRNIALKGNLSSTSFAAKQDIPLSTIPNSVEVGDMNIDGKPDLLVGGRGQISLLRNTTSGGTYSFKETSIAVPGDLINAYLVDMDGDGRLDVATNSFENNNVFITKNTSAGQEVTLSSILTINTSTAISYLAFADLNGDSKPEIITTPYRGNIAAFINNNKSGTLTTAAFGTEISLNSGGPDWTSNAVGDMDNDGRPDIVNNDGYSTISVLYNQIVGVPKLTGFSPVSAKPGETVTVTGQFLTGSNKVTFGGKPASKVTIVSPTVITAVVERGQSGYIAVTNNEGRDSIAGFIYDGPPPPGIDYFTPTSAGEGEKITIRGYNFTASPPIVRIGGIEPKSMTVSSGEIVAIVDTGATGAITVTNIDGTASRAGFTFAPKPELNPSEYRGTRDQTIVLTGRYLNTTTSVTLGGLPVKSFKILSSRQVSIVIGDGENGDLILRTAYGEVRGNFSFVVPHVTFISASPMAAPAGATVIITGTNFSVLPEENVVFFGTARGIVTQASATQLRVTVPLGATYAPISVTVRGYTLYSPKPFVKTFPGGGVINAQTFGARLDIFAGNDVRVFSIADINNDGMADFMIPNYGYSHVDYKFNKSKKGQLIFEHGSMFNRLDGSPIYGVVAEINKDQLIDYVAVTDNGKLVNVRNHNGQQFLQQSDTYIGFATSVVANDMNLDGFTDAVPFFGSSNFRSYIADLDNDNKPDLLYTDEKGIFVKRNKTVPGADYAQYDPDYVINTSQPTQHLAISDYDGDGKTDLIGLSSAEAGNTANLTVYSNASATEKLTFIKQQTIVVEKELYRSGFCAAGDVDGDGRVDLLFSAKRKVLVFKNTSTVGNITFASPVAYDADGSKYLAVADFDGDGMTDIAGLGDNDSGTQIFILRNLTGTLPVTSIEPIYGPVGTTISINGSGLKSATGVSINGHDLKQYTIVSDNKISAVVDTTISGYITITTKANSATSLMKYYTADAPIISPADTVYILPGDAATLEANKMGYYTDGSFQNPYYGNYLSEYVWSNNGKDIQRANGPQYTTSNPGAYTLSLPIYNAGRLTSKPVVVMSIPKVPVNNFLVAATGATCRGSSNGMITVKSKLTANFTAKITGGTYSYNTKFTTGFTVNDLPAGTYSICITPDGHEDMQQCFQAVVLEPKDITLYTALSNDKKNVTLFMHGSSRYFISLNGIARSTTDSVIYLPLNKGRNQLQITTDKLCQGVIERVINTSTEIYPYPNPLNQVLYIAMGDEIVNKARVEIYSAMGNLVFKQDFNHPGSLLQMDVSSIRMTGAYTLKLATDKNPPITFNLVKQ